MSRCIQNIVMQKIINSKNNTVVSRDAIVVAHVMISGCSHNSNIMCNIIVVNLFYE